MDTNLPESAGIGFKPKHLSAVLSDPLGVSWLEVHPENYMGAGGVPHRTLKSIRDELPISMHGVGMSLGSANGVDEEHLKRLVELVDRYQPAQVSEHLAWSHWNQVFLNDLLPMPYTSESLALVASNIDRVQESLKRPILVENPSLYLQFDGSKFEGEEFSEAVFLNRLVEQTGCGLLFDVNNLYVCANNQKFDAQKYLDELDIEHIGEVHLAGHSSETLADGSELLIDDHGSVVRNEVWSLYQSLVQRLGHMPPTLIEWDTDTPDFTQMNQQATLANQRASAALEIRLAQDGLVQGSAA